MSQSIGPDGPCVVSAGAMKYVASFLNSAVPSARAIQSSKFVGRMQWPGKLNDSNDLAYEFASPVRTQKVASLRKSSSFARGASFTR